MTIRRTIPVYIGLLVVAIVAVSYGVAHVMMARSFAKVEKWQAQHSLAAVIAVLDGKIANLDDAAGEWAARAECFPTAGFAAPECLRALIETTAPQRGIEIAAFLDPDGEIVEAYERIPRPGRVAAPFNLGIALLGHQGATPFGRGLASSGGAGLVRVDGTPTVVALRPLPPAPDSGVSQGALLVGYRLTPALLRSMGDREGSVLSIVSPSDSGLGAELGGLGDGLGAGSGFVIPLNAGTMAGYAAVTVLPGHPPLCLRAAMPRPVHNEARHALLHSMLALGIAAVGFSLLGLVASEKLVLERLAKLSSVVRLIGSGGGMSIRVWTGGSDELADLARAINGMLDSLEASQETLRASEERFRRMADSIPDGLAIIEDGVTVYVNDRACEIVGYPRDELLRMQGTDLAAPEERERLRAILEEVRLGHIYPHEIIFWIQRKDGTRRCVQNRYSLSRKGETVTGRFVVTTDVTERVVAGRELERLRGFNERIVQTVAEGIVADDARGIYTFVNPAAAALMGYAPEELVGRPWREVTPSDQNQVVEEANRRRRMGISDRYELEIVRKDGTRRRILVSGSALMEAGEFAGTIAVFSDITERKREEQERERLLHETQQRTEQIRRIMDTVPDGVALADEALHIVMANPAAQEYLSVLGDTTEGTVESLGGASLTDIVATSPGTWRELRSRGGDRTFELVARPLDSRGWVLVIRDVTHELAVRRSIQESERVAAIGRLAAGIAHDFNNLLSGIIGYAQLLLRDRTLSPASAERAKSIAAQGQRGAELVGQILDYSRQSLLDRSVIDLGRVVAETGEGLRSAMPGNIRVSVAYTAEPCWVNGSAEQLQRVILNLAFNARDAMPQGGDLSIGLATASFDAAGVPRSEMSPGHWAVLKVADTGGGIPPEHLPRLFQPYFTTKDVGKGRGLGLPQVHGLVRQHDGFIDVTTVVGQGTTCTIYLPLHAAGPSPERNTACQEETRNRGDSILLVEDEPAVLEVGTAMLEQLGYAVRSAPSGPEAMEFYRRHAAEIDLVLTDIAMPGMDGIALLEQLFAVDPSVKVLVMTGYPLDEGARCRLPSACVGWLKKPVTMDKLRDAVESALGRRPGS